MRRKPENRSPVDEHGSGVLPIDGDDEGEARQGETRSRTTREGEERDSELGLEGETELCIAKLSY